MIAGTAGGVRLGPVPPGTRPVADRAREGLFSSIAADVEGARVLDLFAGTGAMGIEALSRGADAATFVDRAPAAVQAIQDNLVRTGLERASTTVRDDAIAYLRRDPPPEAFDLVLLDPPYDLGGDRLGAVLRGLGAGWLPERRWKVCLTRAKRSSTVVVPIDWVVARRLEYGDSVVICYQRED